ncbi:uncharacterized protein LOC128206092 isoform X2 [Mya arenaria]|uniref:uncharacterized protein LOC128206092 isoform X2 n=1 Tax=Mya arenaria TaxID=6604 RepID=UPI0022E3D1A4|nr:uncharacterized protein LOC128206092 isoform X2 [Mya arenaria]
MVSESEHAPIADPLLCRTMGGESVAGCPQRMEGGTGDDQCPQRMEGGTGDDQCPQRMEGGTGDDQCPQRMEGGTHGDDQRTSYCTCLISPRNCSRNHDLYSTFIKSDAYIDGSNPPVRRLSSSSQPLQKSKISSSKNSSGSCNSVIRGCDTNACDIPVDVPVFQKVVTSVHTKGVFKAVDPNCTHICVAQRDFNFIGDCPLTHCDYECAAQRFANRVGFPDGTEYHCALNHNKPTEYNETWAVVQNCSKGEQPYISFYENTRELPPNNGKIVCDKCNDTRYYNNKESTPSNTYYRCPLQKWNLCTPDNHKLNCGISWKDRTESDGFCRCDYEHGYAPFGVDVPMCFSSNENCIRKNCPSENELVSNYSCVPVCSEGHYRDKTTGQCVPILNPPMPSVAPTTLTTTVKTPSQSTHHPLLVTSPSTTEVKQPTPAVQSNKETFIIIISCVATICIVAVVVICFLWWQRRERNFSEENIEPEAEQLQSGVTTGQGSVNATAQTVHHKTEIHVHKGHFFQIEGGTTNIETPGTRGRNGQRKKTLIEEMELSDFSMMDETSDATPERDRRKRNQQSKASGRAKYEGCSDDEEAEPFMSPPTKQSSSLHKPNQKDLNPEKDRDDLNDQQEKLSHKKSDLNGEDRFSSHFAQPKQISRPIQDDKIPSEQSGNEDENIGVNVTEQGEDNEQNRLPPAGETEGMHRVGSGLSRTVSPIPDIPQERSIKMDKPDVRTDEFMEDLARELLEEIKLEPCVSSFKWSEVLETLQHMAHIRGMELSELTEVPTDTVPFTVHKEEQQHYEGVPDGFVACKSSGTENSCLYQSISVLLKGNESLQCRLRLAAFVFILQNIKSFRQQVIKYGMMDAEKELQVVTNFLQSDIDIKSSNFSNIAEGITHGLNVLVQQTAQLGCDSSPFQVDFLCGALKRDIKSFYQIDLVPTTSFIPWIPIIEGQQTNEQQLHIFWTSLDSLKGVSGRMNHIVPLFKVD